MATLPMEETESSEEIEGLVYKRLEGRYRGWRVELLEEQLTNKLEEKFLLCSYCSGVMRDACLLEREGKQELRCLVCIPEGVSWQPSLMSRESINEKIIRCTLRGRGCDWIGTVVGGIRHLKECEFLPVTCPLKCVESDGGRRGEVVRVERRQLAEHEREFCSQRKLKCEFCGGAVRACEMNPHLGECEEFPVDCPNGCEAAEETGTRQVKRGALPLHLSECPLQRVECPYREYGCGEEMEMERRQLDLHEREYVHTHFRLAFEEMKRKQMESNYKMKLLEKENKDLKDSQILEANNKINCLEKLSAIKDSEIISINKEIKELKTLSIEMKQKQTESNKLKDSQILEANNKIKCLEKQDTKLKNEIKELKEIISNLVSGGLEWKIAGVKQKIEKKEITYTDPFYVGLYKCQGCILWNCDDTGEVGFIIHIMKGEFDDKLKWPFIYKAKFVLLNQNRNEDNHILSDEVSKDDLKNYPECFQKPTEIRNGGIGAVSFISNAEIFTEKYCKEDSISIHITVENCLLSKF